MYNVRNYFRMTMDTMDEPSINVHVGERKILKFEEVESGLCIFCVKHNNNNSSQKDSAYPFLTLVSSNKENFTRREVEMTNKAKELYRLFGFPGYNKYISAVRNGCILKCPINIDNIKRSIHIYGPYIAGMKGNQLGRNYQGLKSLSEYHYYQRYLSTTRIRWYQSIMFLYGD